MPPVIHGPHEGASPATGSRASMDAQFRQDWSRFYVPEIHDVYPGMEARLDDMLGVLPEPARREVPLLVVPNWQGKACLDPSGDFAKRIKAHAGAKVLHGWTHSLGPDFMNWLLYGHDNRSEFARLDAPAAEDRLLRGIAVFAEAFGAAPEWFCAPRWQQSRKATDVMGKLGFRGYMARGAYRLMTGESVPLPALNFDEGDRPTRTRYFAACAISPSAGCSRMQGHSGWPCIRPIHSMQRHGGKCARR